MKIFRFNTNIDNPDSMQQLSGVLNQDRRIISFKVNPKEGKHEMEVSCSDDISEREVRHLVSMAGFETSDINESGMTRGVNT